MANELLTEIHVYFIEEREIGPLFNGIAPDIKKRCAEFEEEKRNSILNATPETDTEEAFAEVSALRGRWNQLCELREEKMVRFARGSEGKKYPEGILEWEKEGYRLIARGIYTLRSPSGQGRKDEIPMSE